MKPAKKCSLLISLSLLLWLVMASCTGTRTTTSNTLIDQGTLLFVDQSDNGYVLRGQRSLVKYDFRNHPADRHDFDLSIHDAGLSTDLRIYAFNSDFQKFYILDKYLNEISQYAFNEYFDFLVRHPVLANGQNIWLYNQTEHKLQEYSTQLKFLTETRNLDWEIAGVRVDQLIFHRNEIYLVDHSRGVFIFDYAGRLRQRIPFPTVSRHVQIDKAMSRIYAFFANQWHVIDPDEPIPGYVPLNLPFTGDFDERQQLIFQNGKIYRWNRTMQEIEVFENTHIIMRE